MPDTVGTPHVRMASKPPQDDSPSKLDICCWCLAGPFCVFSALATLLSTLLWLEIYWNVQVDFFNPQGINAHFIQLLFYRRKVLVKTLWFRKVNLTWTQPLRCVDLTFRLELLNRFLNKFLLSRLWDPSQMLRKVHGQTKWAKWLRVASLLAKISRLGPKVALISSQLVDVGSLFEDVSYTEMMMSHEFSPPCMTKQKTSGTTKWSWVVAGPAATEGWSIVSALRCYEDIPRCLCAIPQLSAAVLQPDLGATDIAVLDLFLLTIRMILCYPSHRSSRTSMNTMNTNKNCTEYTLPCF